MSEVFNPIYDNATLHVDCDVATEEQIEEVIRETIKLIETGKSKKIDCNVYVNVVRNREGVSQRIAYVWINNPEVYSTLITRPNVDLVQVERTSSSSSISSSVSSGLNLDLSKSWADIIEEDEDSKRIKVPEFEYTPEQVEQLKEDSEEELVPKTGKLIFSRAFASPLEEDEQANVLFAHSCPEDVTEEQIRAEFYPFTTIKEHRTFKIERPSSREAAQFKSYSSTASQKREIIKSYPIVTITTNRKVYVTFSPKSNDARFVLYLKKKIYFPPSTEEGVDPKNRTVIFHQAKNRSIR